MIKSSICSVDLKNCSNDIFLSDVEICFIVDKTEEPFWMSSMMICIV